MREDRLQTAIRKEMLVDGKSFCWHDWTSFPEPTVRNHIFDWGFKHLCVKCGKSRVFNERMLEPITS